MELVRKNTYNNDVVFIDGQCSSGKCMLAHILECYDGVEKSRVDTSFYYITKLYNLRKISKNTAITLLRTEADRRIYDLMLGRGINYRYTDATSVFNYPYPLEYLKRIFLKDREPTNKRIETKNPMLQEMIHNELCTSNLYFSSFGDRARIIYMVRNPIELICNINSRDFGDRIGKDKSEFQLTYDWNGNNMPLYAIGWEKEFINANPIDRIVKMVSVLGEMDYGGYLELSTKRKKQVKFIIFNEFVQNPMPICRDIGDFLSRKMTFKMKRTLKRERCPRKVDNDKLEMMEHQLRKRITEDSNKILDNLMMRYNNWCKDW